MIKTDLRRFARELCKKSTDAEMHLWYYLRANRLGFKFKRQVPLKYYIVDFLCFERRLIIELDGDSIKKMQPMTINAQNILINPDIKF